MRKVISRWLQEGITIVASAGNFNKWDLFYPASYEGIISVWALDEDNKKANFSNYGSWIIIAAPGTDIDAAIFDNQYKAFDGTSEASAFVAWLISYGYAHWFTLHDIITNVTPSDANVGKWYINFSNLCDMTTYNTSTDSSITQDIDEDNLSDDSLYEIQSNRKKTIWYMIWLLWVILLVGVVYYVYRNRNIIKNEQKK